MLGDKTWLTVGALVNPKDVRWGRGQGSERPRPIAAHQTGKKTSTIFQTRRKVGGKFITKPQNTVKSDKHKTSEYIYALSYQTT